MTELMVNTMQELNLIVPWEIKVAEPGGAPREVEGIHRVDEETLNGLSDKNWWDLKNRGAMGMIYAQLLSMGNFEKLLQGMMNRVHINRRLKEAETNIEGLFEGEHETLDFDNL